MASRVLGICVGASTIKLVEIDEKYKVNKVISKSHECNPRDALKEILDKINIKDYDYVTLTGRKFKDLLNLPKITEPEATEYAVKEFIKKNPGNYNGLVSLGSENFILYGLNEKGHIIKVQTGNKCASGTGEFFLQQIARMDLDVDEAISLAGGNDPHRVSGRCSVFCKSDCTHALNKGVAKGEVTAGLGDMMADKVLELLQSEKNEDIIVVGGVTKNSYVVDRLKNKIKNLAIPKEADVFEAYGAAVYALIKKQSVEGEIDVADSLNSFSTLPALNEGENLVEFKDIEKGEARDGDECILGLDVGSTTTKAVLMRMNDNSMLASIYLRTNGDPVGASINCYKEIDKQLNGIDVKIIALGVTGSGRQISGLHALTDGVINEIIAHATAAAYFDKDVDTIFEIGGQDAKYTYLVNGVPCDYAMNEACSAGTGSFLEEAAKESLNINYLEIQDIALKAKNPPNFNDQCAAFISSDIKNASHEDIGREDIVAGLVYSICMNYTNRVKGARKVGNKIFMQGGVCYNKAVPLAMASLINKPIIVPPEPGLMGAFGVALEAKNRIVNGLLDRSSFNLKELIDRKVEYGKSFTCPGTQENCDRGCNINVIKLNGKNYAFGGICNKYYNILHHLDIDPKPLDVVERRQEIIFDKISNEGERSIAISRSFYTNILFPLYFNFFDRLGIKVVLSDDVDTQGTKMTNSAMCFPAEIAHGIFKNIIEKDTDYIFLPQVTELYVYNSKNRHKGIENHCTCVLAQSEPYYIKSAFRNTKQDIISPVLNFSKGWMDAEDEFIEIGKELGFDKEKSREAFKEGVRKLEEANRKKKKLGKEILSELEKDKGKTGIVLFGRSYNAFAEEGNLGIPMKFASRGYYIIPFDMLPFEDEESIENMTWATGQDIIRCARFVKKHPQLFGAYITNFSCGPDSFIVGYFRDIMKTKPSLTLELDSHSADAGVNTRVEAFLDIVERYRKLCVEDEKNEDFTPAEINLKNGRLIYTDSDGIEHDAKEAKLLFPSMGRTNTELCSAAFRAMGFNALSVDLPDFKTLMLGRANTSCKECLPLILTTSSLLDYMNKREDEDELLMYFMPTSNGSCRFSQYYVFLKELVKKKRFRNVAMMTLTSENSYAGLGAFDQLKVLRALIIADIMDDIKNAINVLAKDKKRAEKIYDKEWKRLVNCVEKGQKDIYNVLEGVADSLSKIKLKQEYKDAKKVVLAGEIYVRRDEFSSQAVIDSLAKRDIVVKRSPTLEWLYYVDYLVKNYFDGNMCIKEKIELTFRQFVQNKTERKVKKILAKSGLCDEEHIDIEKIIDTGSQFIRPELTGEAIVVVGAFFSEIITHMDGMISIGPFSCLPTRITESILNVESKVVDNDRLLKLDNYEDMNKHHTLPFLSIEADGNPFPQIVEARLEAFALQVERMHKNNHGS